MSEVMSDNHISQLVHPSRQQTSIRYPSIPMNSCGLRCVIGILYPATIPCMFDKATREMRPRLSSNSFLPMRKHGVYTHLRLYHRPIISPIVLTAARSTAATTRWK
jgi:hypothetical protein